MRSGVNNYKQCKIQLPSKFNFDYLERELVNYGDKQVTEFLRYGFPVDCRPGFGSSEVQANHKGAMEFPQEVVSLLQKEVRLGGTLGPFPASVFKNPKFSPLNSVPKKDSDEHRLILDLSMPPGNLINDGIDKDVYLGHFEKLQLPSIDKLVERIVQIATVMGKPVKIFKIDLSRAYKQLFINPIDFEKMGFVFQDKFNFDCSLSMGSRSSTRCCQRVTNAVVYIFTKYGYFAINYLDDLGGAETEERAERAFAKLRQILKDFGLTEATAKSCSPSHCMVFLGIEVNTVLFILRIPSEKLAEIVQTLDEWQDKIMANVKDVQNLAGLLNFSCRCIRTGRVYLS